MIDKESMPTLYVGIIYYQMFHCMLNFPDSFWKNKIIANANIFTNKAHHIITEDAMHILIANINLIFDSASKKQENYSG